MGVSTFIIMPSYKEHIHLSAVSGGKIETEEGKDASFTERMVIWMSAKNVCTKK